MCTVGLGIDSIGEMYRQTQKRERGALLLWSPPHSLFCAKKTALQAPDAARNLEERLRSLELEHAAKLAELESRKGA
jgi:hypothetical protein